MLIDQEVDFLAVSPRPILCKNTKARSSRKPTFPKGKLSTFYFAQNPSAKRHVWGFLGETERRGKRKAGGRENGERQVLHSEERQ